MTAIKNRLIHRVTELQKHKKKIFCAFITLGYPSLAVTEKLILEFEKIGVDILELGIPFSDPMADGPTIQHSSEEALKQGVSLAKAFHMVAGLRKKGCRIPIVCFSYMNPIYRFGIRKFPAMAAQSGFDGVLIPDLIPEEEREFQTKCKRSGLANIFLISPTTRMKRAKTIAKNSQGFIYYVSLRGVTGARKSLPSEIRKEFEPFHRMASKKPLLIGFGIGDAARAKSMAALSEGVIVGSAIVDRLTQHRGNIRPVVKWVHSMIKAVKGVHS